MVLRCERRYIDREISRCIVKVMQGKLYKFILLINVLLLGIAYADWQDEWSSFVPTEKLLSRPIKCLGGLDSTIYVGTTKGLNVIRGEEVSSLPGAPRGEVESITFDKIGRLWCIINGRIHVLTEDYWSQCLLIALDTLNGGRATDLEMGITDLFVGTNRGLIYLVNAKEPIGRDTVEIPDSSSVDSFTIETRPSEFFEVSGGRYDLFNETFHVRHYKRGEYLLSTPNGFFIFDSKQEVLRTALQDLAPYPHTTVCSEVESDSVFWVSGVNRVFKIIDSSEGVFQPIPLPVSNIHSFAFDSTGQLWAISSSRLFEIYPQAAVSHEHNLPDSLKGTHLNTLIALDDAQLLLGTEKGILSFKPARPTLVVNITKVYNYEDGHWIRFKVENADAYPCIISQRSIDGEEWFELPSPRIQEIRIEKDYGLPLGKLKGGKHQVTVRVEAPLEYVGADEDTFSFIIIPVLGIVASQKLISQIIFGGIIGIVVIVGLYVLFSQLRKKLETEKLQRGKHLLGRNPYIVGPPIINPEYFVGRENFLKRIWSVVHNNSVLIYGERRVGKTSLLYQIRHRIRSEEDENYKIIPIMIDLEKFGKVPGIKKYRRSPKFFFTNLVYAIAKAVYDKRYYSKVLKRKYDYSEFEDFMEQVAKHLQVKSTEQQVRVVLIIDEGDEMTFYGSDFHKQFRGVFQSSYAESFNIVLALREFTGEWRHKTSPWYNFFIIYELGPLTRDETDYLVQSYVRGAVKYRKGALKRIWNHTLGYPHVVQQLCSDIYDALDEDDVYVNKHLVKKVYKKMRID